MIAASRSNLDVSARDTGEIASCVEAVQQADPGGLEGRIAASRGGWFERNLLGIVYCKNIDFGKSILGEGGAFS